MEYNTEILHQVRQYLLLLLLLIFITINIYYYLFNTIYYCLIIIYCLIFMSQKQILFQAILGAKNFTSYTLNFCYFLSFKIF